MINFATPCIWTKYANGDVYTECHHDMDGSLIKKYNFRFCPFCGEEILFPLISDPWPEDE